MPAVGNLCCGVAGIINSFRNSQLSGARAEMPGPQDARVAAIQKVYDACKIAWKNGRLTSMESLKAVALTMKNVSSSDVCLVDPLGQGGVPADINTMAGRAGAGGAGPRGPPSWTPPRRGRAPPITYLHIHECPDFSMGIFCLPTSATIPLHNHPGMIVISKILYGSMHVRSYDWCDEEGKPLPPAEHAAAERASLLGHSRLFPRPARPVLDNVFHASDEPGILFPTSGGNIHAFTALTPVAVLDVLAPPYAPGAGRDCTYYREVPAPYGPATRVVPGGAAGAGVPVEGSKQAGDESEGPSNVRWLLDCDPHDDFVIQRGNYRGPRVS
eukprot:jgi/Mesvir1/28458/Mv15881-RA.1